MLPFLLFSSFATLSAILTLFLPETFKQEKLPDSIADIKKNGRNKIKNRNQQWKCFTDNHFEIWFNSESKWQTSVCRILIAF